MTKKTTSPRFNSFSEMGEALNGTDASTDTTPATETASDDASDDSSDLDELLDVLTGSTAG